MPGRIPAARHHPALRVAAGDWAHAPVAVAATIPARRRGLRPLALGWGMLLSGGSVHGHGMVEPLTVVGVGGDGSVTSVAELRPGERLRARGAVAVLEIPAGAGAPRVGDLLHWTALPG